MYILFISVMVGFVIHLHSSIHMFLFVREQRILTRHAVLALRCHLQNSLYSITDSLSYYQNLL